MKNIVKTFIEIYLLDMEGRRGEWKVTNKSYEEAIKGMNPWVTGVREVEKIFNPDTFIITEKILKITE